ncbi:M23 family metallopeptidase [Haliangium sp.]|uniref:M23 family metallopeptidase n=1 Tax=Haliangium sp. TaxID=2663208 RepID=UPI003D138F2D
MQHLRFARCGARPVVWLAALLCTIAWLGPVAMPQARADSVGVGLDRDRPELMRAWPAQPWRGDDVLGSPTLVVRWLTGGLRDALAWCAHWLPEAGPAPTPAQVLAGLLVAPVAGEESSGFGYRRDPFRRRRRHRRMHRGVDYKADRGAPVYAAGPGVIRYARRRGSYGRLIIIDHGAGVETRYAHLSRIRVDRGQRVEAGDRIGAVGATGRATGPHLHFELRIDGDALDPRRVLAPLLPPPSMLARGR